MSGFDEIPEQYHSVTLTNRENDVLFLLTKGAKNWQIAQILNISIRTVKFHTTNIYNKIGCTSRYEAIVWALSNLHEIEPIKKS